jgi:uncharacterized cupredoxin-like copper-binding protein
MTAAPGQPLLSRHANCAPEFRKVSPRTVRRVPAEPIKNARTPARLVQRTRGMRMFETMPTPLARPLLLLAAGVLLAACSAAAPAASPAATLGASASVGAASAASPVGAASTAASPASASGSASAAASGTAVSAKETEFKIELASSTAPAGSVTFQINNAGTIVHEFVVMKTDLAADKLPVDPGKGVVSEETPGLSVVDEVEDIAVGASPTLTVDLPASHYVVICNIPGHYTGGMHADFTTN